MAQMVLPKGIRLKPNGKFEYNITVDGYRTTGTCDTLEDALLAKLEVARNSVKGKQESKTIQSITVDAAIELTVKYRWDGLKYESYAVGNASYISEFFGASKSVMDIDTEAVNRFVDYLKERGLSDGTINRKLTALSVILQTVEDHGKPTARPVIRRRKEYKGRERFITPDEEAKILRLLSVWEKPDEHDCTVCLLDTGLRCGELLSLEKGDIKRGQGQYGTLTVWRTKNNNPRTVPMTLRVSNIIMTRVGMAHGQLLFPYKTNWISHYWRRLRRAMKLNDDKGFVPHALRHTCASRLVQSGVSIPIVKAWLGHESIQSTMRYAHLAPTTLYDVVGVLEKFTDK